MIDDRTGLVKKAPGIPFGLSFVGRRFSAATLIGLAFAFEQASASMMVAQALIAAAHAREQLKHADGVKLPTTQLVDVVHC